MNPKTLDRLIWVLIYGGLIVLCTGVYLVRSGQKRTAIVVIAGAVSTLVGLALIYVRSRLRDGDAAQGRQ
jgi:uncharacterized membrane protein